MMTYQYTLPWAEPLDVAAHFAEESEWVLLHSGRRAAHTGRYSYFARRALHTLAASGFTELSLLLTQDKPIFDNAWYGYLSYELRHDLERYAPDAEPAFISIPALMMIQFGEIWVFDHESESIMVHSNTPIGVYNIAKITNRNTQAGIAYLQTNISRQSYFDKVASIVKDIHAGKYYQANLTRKFFGEFHEAPHPVELFARLCGLSPAQYAACMHMGGIYILSSSPERFLHINADGICDTRPIKGSIARGATADEDARNRAWLEASAKNRAENLMIVDLMRNDLSRACIPGSVSVEKLYEISTYATIHHMSSTVKGRKRPDVTTLDVVKACFPPGSMTGAPKFRAIDTCATHEGMPRGIYSGALGWFGGDGSCDLSVVIRTLIIQDKKFEFQVGGGIVADSSPEEEWRETLAKAAALVSLLNIPTLLMESL